MTKEKCSGFPERYQVGEGCPFQTCRLGKPRADRSPVLPVPYIPSGICRYSVPFRSCLRRKALIEGPTLRFLADPNPGTLP
ncbi:hypothetical protein MSSIT_3007 [Methanosarcina siciliae T4/M]|uniref:Uncharacterized protein n=1 Tax=Methanosarcina siciliae T4/M TaxID=1434120 RepID=A0A0E3L964_9EURY|nr:hypothetical protein [Methanosarcina siciliae]AKB29726.1 hypothetical protein MSSIT_3007 [Methanosarcina siciliae T4/M]